MEVMSNVVTGFTGLVTPNPWDTENVSNKHPALKKMENKDLLSREFSLSF